jgi:hypothetical protein
MTQPPVDEQDADAPPRRLARRGSPPIVTLVLGGVLVLVLGFFGGLGVSKLTGGSGESPRAFPSGRFSAFGTGGPRQPGGGGGGVTVGTVEKIVGSTVYLKTPDGKTVKVTTTGHTSVHVSKPGTVADLTKGSTVVVRGSQKNGTVSADRIDQGGAGLRGPRPSRTP